MMITKIFLKESERLIYFMNNLGLCKYVIIVL